MELKKRENIGWIDLLRVLACFFVVFSHCCDAFIRQWIIVFANTDMFRVFFHHFFLCDDKSSYICLNL